MGPHHFDLYSLSLNGSGGHMTLNDEDPRDSRTLWKRDSQLEAENVDQNEEDP